MSQKKRYSCFSYYSLAGWTIARLWCASIKIPVPDFPYATTGFSTRNSVLRAYSRNG